MPHEFVKRRVGSSELATAVRQQEQLAYFTRSQIQENTSTEYLQAWAERKYNGSDMFLNYVKQIFRTENFMSFFKYFRNPIASAELIQERIKIPLARVFYSEDSFFKYNIRGEVFHNIEELNSKKFDDDMFNALLFKHNDILVTLVQDVNEPVRELISIKNVVAIKSKDSVIHKLAYTATFMVDEQHIKGFLFMDSTRYIFFDKEYKIIKEVPHDLGECPADYITKEAFGDDDAVRLSIFSYIRESMEEYVFLKTLLKMTEPNGVLPITTQLDTKIRGENNDIKGQSSGEPMTSNEIGGQHARVGSEMQGSDTQIQAGNVIKVPIVKKDDGSIDMEVGKNYFTFFHMPVEPLNYINDRILEIKQDIVTSIVGDFVEQNDSAKNELQVSKSFKNQQNKLRAVSLELSRIRNLSDFKFLALEHGKDAVQVDCFYGSDFFLESQEDLFNLYKNNPNPIEAKNLLIKMSRNRNRFNRMKGDREEILYHLLPYSDKADFTVANEKGIDPNLFELQTRFNYWIGLFEARFGDILIFWESLEGSNDEKIVLINGLIMNIIMTANTVEVEEDQSAAKAAQAVLRGSVGGITGIVSMLTNIGEEQTVELLVALYGLERSTAEAIAKRPEGIENNTDQ